MAQPAVVFDGVWKKFRRGERHDSLRDLVPSLAKRMMRRGNRKDLESDQEFWALEDVSFEVGPGEALGIIGPNGAGKSTTLKLLTRILRPTRGTCHVRGRIGALIEVAAGFHPDLTGRENIFLQGAIMGMKKEEIRRRLDEIIEFAGIGTFVDTQVKRYSSGMNARLGFAVAAHLDPNVLIVDEVLSVGDIGFQQKCVDRMQDFKKEGVTIVFVSHNLQAVASLCSQALLIKHSVLAHGSTEDVISRYVEKSASTPTRGEGEVVHITCTNPFGASAGTEPTFAPGASAGLNVTYLSRETLRDIEFGFLIHRTTDGLLVFARGVDSHALGITELRANQPLTINFSFRTHLTRGHYHVECHVLHKPTQRWLGRVRPAALFRIDEHINWGGVTDVELDCQLVDGTGRGSIATSMARAGA